MTNPDAANTPSVHALDAGTLTVLDSGALLASSVALWLCRLAEESAEEFTICLSGGSTPRMLYERLAASPVTGRFPWTRVHWFWGDERLVPRDHPDSNFKMAFDAFLSRAPVPAANIHAIETENLTLAEAALLYERELRSFYGAEDLDRDDPLFDVTLLGLGTDGHTASLLPGDPALGERRHWTAPVRADAARHDRVTLTYPALESSRHVAFLVSGAEKRGVLAEIRSGQSTAPAARLRPAGELLWFADKAAAGA